MAVQRVLQLVNGVLQMLVPNQTSAGAGDAGKIPALNASGLIDATMLASTFASTQTFTAGVIFGVSGTVVLASSGTIAITSPISVVNPSAAVTGVILTSGTVAGQVQYVANISSFSVTFATAATSHVLDGTSDVIAAQTVRQFIWIASLSRWARVA